MPKNFNPIRKAKVKQSLLKGNSTVAALKDTYAVGLKAMKKLLTQCKRNPETPDIILPFYIKCRKVSMPK